MESRIPRRAIWGRFEYPCHMCAGFQVNNPIWHQERLPKTKSVFIRFPCHITGIRRSSVKHLRDIRTICSSSKRLKMPFLYHAIWLWSAAREGLEPRRLSKWPSTRLKGFYIRAGSTRDIWKAADIFFEVNGAMFRVEPPIRNGINPDSAEKS